MPSTELSRGRVWFERQPRRFTRSGERSRRNSAAGLRSHGGIHLLLVLAFTSMIVTTAAAQEALKVDTAGNVGIGASAPLARLHVQPTAGSSLELYLKNDAKNTNVMEVVQADTNGLIFAVYEAPTGEGVFRVFNAAGGENLRFTGQAGGRLAIGCASGIGADLVLNANGGGICGTGTESKIDAGAFQFTVTSSRTIKKNIVPVEGEGILDKISRVGVYCYDFISGPEDNVGLMAEDFHQIFGHGSDKLLNGQEVTIAL